MTHCPEEKEVYPPMKLLSFIIPAYNSEAFLHKCVDSMLVPEVLDKLEIIIVNDGSRDATEAIGKDYERSYPNVVRLISQKNKGHGGALNTGCAAAQGKYLKVIDADDWILSENLPVFLEKLEKTDSDIVLTHFHTINITTGTVKKWRSYPAAYDVPYTFEQIMPSWRSFDRCLTFHGMTYRREFYQEYGTPLLEKRFYEDCEYATFPCCQANSILPLDLFLYQYRVGDSNQSVAAETQLKRITHMDAVLKQMVEKNLLLTDPIRKQYATMKIYDLLVDYLTIALLVNPDKKAGRHMAQEIMRWISRMVPDCYRLALGKYAVFSLLSRLHVSRDTWDRFQYSRAYRFFRNNHSFD